MTKFRVPGSGSDPDQGNVVPFEIKLGDFALEEIAAIQSRGEVESVFQEDQQRSDLETNARLTIIRLFQEAPNLDQEFSFKTRPGKGADYVQAIRQVLSKSRAVLRSKQNTQPRSFKLFLVSIEKQQDHDLVTIVRSDKRKSVIDDLADLIQKELEK